MFVFFRHIFVPISSIFSLYIFFLSKWFSVFTFLLSLSIFPCYFYNNRLLCLMLFINILLFLCFLVVSSLILLYNVKKIYIFIHFFYLSQNFSLNLFGHVPKMNSIIISFNWNNSNIIKVHSFLHEIMTTIAKIWFILNSFIEKIPIMTNYIFFWFIWFINISSFWSIYPIIFIVLIIHTYIHLRKLVDSICCLLEKQI